MRIVRNPEEFRRTSAFKGRPFGYRVPVEPVVLVVVGALVALRGTVSLAGLVVNGDVGVLLVFLTNLFSTVGLPINS